MSIRIEKKYIPSNTIETTIVSMPEEDYRRYRRSNFVLEYVVVACMLSGFPGCAATLVGGMYFAGTVLNFTNIGALGFGVLLSSIVSGGALFLGERLEDKYLNIREELLKKHGLVFDTWYRRWPRHSVELDKKT